MHNYTGNPAVVLVDPPTVSLISDGDQLDSAHLNPSHQQNTDYVANYVRYGAKLNAPNGFNFECAFAAKVDLLKQTRRSDPFVLSDVADQTINPNTQQTNFYLGVITAAGSRIVRLDTAAVSNGDWARITFVVPVGVDVWRFRRGVDDTHNICTLDNSIITQVAGASVLGGSTNIDGASVEFQVIGGVWRMISTNIAAKPGTYA